MKVLNFYMIVATLVALLLSGCAGKTRNADGTYPESQKSIPFQDFDENSKRIPLTQSQRLVAPSEISQLPQPTLQRGIHGWMTVTGWDAVLILTWPITKFEKVREGVELAEWINQIPVADVSDHVVHAAVNTGKKRLIKKSDKRGDES